VGEDLIDQEDYSGVVAELALRLTSWVQLEGEAAEAAVLELCVLEVPEEEEEEERGWISLAVAMNQQIQKSSPPFEQGTPSDAPHLVGGSNVGDNNLRWPLVNIHYFAVRLRACKCSVL
jgi:hypothetical protein